jgi:hypothetical protein
VDDDDVSSADAARAPTWTAHDPASVRRRAKEWLRCDALATLVSGLDGPTPATPAELLAWSTTTLDTRGGLERHEVAPFAWLPDRVELILAAAEPLGLMRTARPGRDAYDVAVILGGTTTGNRLRTRLAADLAGAGISLGTLVVLTADRPLTGRERSEAAPDEATESENALRNAGEQFGPLTPRDLLADVDHGRDQSYVGADGQPVRLLVAPPGTGGRRATTADGIRFALGRLAPDERRHALLVTSAIYAPFQFFRVAPLLLANGVELAELVGTDTAATGDAMRLAQRLAQETHAAIHAATDLLAQAT